MTTSATTSHAQPNDTLSVGRLVAAFGFATLGCLALLTPDHDLDGFLGFFFAIASLLLTTQHERQRIHSRRELLQVALTLIAVVAICVFTRHLQLPWLRAALHHPAFVAPLWLFVCVMLIRRWRAQRFIYDAQSK
jgi:hypothetical protein